MLRECAGRYRPTSFHEMLERYGGLETANRLLKPAAYVFSQGFQRLCEMRKPHLGVFHSRSHSYLRRLGGRDSGGGETRDVQFGRATQRSPAQRVRGYVRRAE